MMYKKYIQNIIRILSIKINGEYDCKYYVKGYCELHSYHTLMGFQYVRCCGRKCNDFTEI